MIKVKVLTSNKGKFLEIKTKLNEIGITAQQLKLPHPEIQAETIDEVVLFKCEWTRRTRMEDAILVDDSGLFVESLNGFPGVYSSYVFQTLGCDGILNLMREVSNRNARFECCFAFSTSKLLEPLTFKGVCNGTISGMKVGKNGFGFDPIFIPEHHKITFAEMNTVEKNSISHRGKAIDQLIEYLKSIKNGIK